MICTITRYSIIVLTTLMFCIGMASSFYVYNYLSPYLHVMGRDVKGPEVISDIPYVVPRVIGRLFDIQTATVCAINAQRSYDAKITHGNMLMLEELHTPFNKSNVFCSVWKHDDVIWITFRGTLSYTEGVADFKMSQVGWTKRRAAKLDLPVFMKNDHGIKIHSGFIDIYSSFRANLIKAITANSTITTRICIAGHSLGGSIAVITGFDLKTIGYDAIVYTFSAPRIGNSRLVEAVGNICLPVFRIYNSEDVMCHIPLPVSPNRLHPSAPFYYYHVGRAYQFTDHTSTLAGNHSIDMILDNLKNLKVL